MKNGDLKKPETGFFLIRQRNPPPSDFKAFDRMSRTGKIKSGSFFKNILDNLSAICILFGKHKS